ncbi:MAG TPA: hypothetical protein VH593_05490, partial [Ktedonobacteraceae bacterium]
YTAPHWTARYPVPDGIGTLEYACAKADEMQADIQGERIGYSGFHREMVVVGPQGNVVYNAARKEEEVA